MFRIFSKNKCKDKVLSKSLRHILGFKPKNISIYILALTHKSAIDHKCKLDYDNNERLEFLGDAILDSVISEILYNRFPTADEGFLTQMRTKIVNGKKLCELAKKIGLNEIIISKTKISSKILEDAFEALIGAIFIDRDYKHVKQFITQRIMINHIQLNELRHVESNYKSKIIEWGQKHRKEVVFSTTLESADSKVFISRVIVNGNEIANGKGKAKKIAEQNASFLAIKVIEKNGY